MADLIARHIAIQWTATIVDMRNYEHDHPEKIPLTQDMLRIDLATGQK
jgi:hypothetical protein